MQLARVDARVERQGETLRTAEPVTGTASAFASYEEGRRAEVVVQVETVRRQLRFQRDRDALLRASTDDAFRAQIFGPLCYESAARGSLRTELAQSDVARNRVASS